LWFSKQIQFFDAVFLFLIKSLFKNYEKYLTTKSQKKNQKKKIFQRAKKLTFEAIILIEL